MLSFEIIATDRHGYGHQPQRYNGIPAIDEVAAIDEARARYGKTTGLNSDDIAVNVLSQSGHRPATTTPGAPIDTEGLFGLMDFRCPDDDHCGVTIFGDPTTSEYLAVTIETGHLIARTQSPLAAVAHAGAALIAYGTDGVQGEGSWTATVEYGLDVLNNVRDIARAIADYASYLRLGRP